LQASIRRLAKDHATLRAALPPNYLLPQNDDSTADNLTQLTTLVTGAQDTPYSDGLWQLHLKIPSDYPKSPPKATFKTRIYHPNVDEKTGAVCLETLKRDWDPKLTLKDILVTISCLLIQPNPDSALNAAAGALIQEDYDAFAEQARLMTKIHAPIPSSMRSAVDQARRRGEEVEPESVPIFTPSFTSDEQDDTKENEPSKAGMITEVASQPSKSSLGKRPLTELPASEDPSEVRRKSPKTIPDPGTDEPDSTTAPFPSLASGSVSLRKGTVAARRIQPRMGIRRL
jgi:ubiquitin-conjugating enzyme E2 S